MSSKKYIQNYNFNKDKQVLNFVLSYKDTSIPNAIRRTLSSYIPTYSIDIDSICITRNNTIFHNERIVHILTLVPVKNYIKDGDYEKVNFSLSKAFDKDKVNKNDLFYNERIMIYTDDIKSSDGKSYFLSGMPIVEVRKGQKLIIDKMKLKRGTQQEHAQFQSCIVTYKIISNTPEKVTTEMNISPVAINPLDHSDIYPHSPQKLLRLSIDILIEKCNNLKKNIDNIVIEKLPISLKDFGGTKKSDIFATSIIINNEDHTMGYLLQSVISNMSEFKDKEFVGYRVPHPLKKNIVIKMITSNPKKVIVNALSELIKIFTQIKSEIK